MGLEPLKFLNFEVCCNFATNNKGYEKITRISLDKSEIYVSWINLSFPVPEPKQCCTITFIEMIYHFICGNCIHFMISKIFISTLNKKYVIDIDDQN